MYAFYTNVRIYDQLTTFLHLVEAHPAQFGLKRCTMTLSIMFPEKSKQTIPAEKWASNAI